MALTLNNFTGFETGGLQEAKATQGDPVATSAVVRTGSYALECDDSTDRFSIEVFEGGSSDVGDDYIVGFAYRTNNANPIVDVNIFELRDTDGAVPPWRLEIEGTAAADRGKLRFVPSGGGSVLGSTALASDRWYYIEVRFQKLDSGTFDVFLDGVSEISGSGKDMDRGFAYSEYAFMPHASTAADSFYDDFYCMSGATGTSDFLGPRTEVLGAYQNTVEDATDQGSALNNGTWADVGATPFVDGTQADYQQTGAIEGYTICDEGIRAGPAGDAPGTITGAKYIQRMARTNGSSPTTLDKSFGNSGDGVTAVDVAATLTVAFQNLFVVSEAATVVPTNSENFAHGMGQTGSGGRDVLAHEMSAMLLHTHPALSTTLADMNFPDQNYYLGPFGT